KPGRENGKSRNRASTLAHQYVKLKELRPAAPVRPGIAALDSRRGRASPGSGCASWCGIEGSEGADGLKIRTTGEGPGATGCARSWGNRGAGHRYITGISAAEGCGSPIRNGSIG